MPDALPVPRHLRPRALTAAATTYTPQEYRAGGIWHTQSWQAEAWGFYNNLGEFSEAVDWQARAMSRIHLAAAEVMPEGPQLLEEGPAADLMAAFCGGAPGHAAFLAAITPHLKVPGEGWLIAERADPSIPLAAAEWGVYSTECVDARGGGWWVQVGDSVWRPLAVDALPMRIHQPHPRYPWLATSSAEAAVPIMRRIDLIDRRIIAMMISRLAMNGLLLIPQEGTFSVPEQYGEGPDAFVAMLIDIAGKNIADPGRASAGIPIPVTFTQDLIEKWKILKPEDPLDEWLLKEREDELGRLGDALSISRERVSGGIGQANHWCVDDQTQVLTESGWRYQDELATGDIVLTLNHQTGLAEWQPVQDIYRAQVDNELMIGIERKNHSSLTTPDHRWPVLRTRTNQGDERVSREWSTTARLGQEHRIITAAICADMPVQPKYSDELVELVAWLWTEGNISQGRSVSIAQSHGRNPGRVARIRACLTRLYGPARTDRAVVGTPSWRENIQSNLSSHGGPVTIFTLNQAASELLIDLAPGKRVRCDVVRSLTAAQLELFIDVSCQGDGWHYRSGRQDIWQRDHDMLDAFELALILTGRMITNTVSDGGRVVSPWKKTPTVRPLKGLYGQQDGKLRRYSGVIWCPTTPNRTWLARRKGTVYFTGNSAWQISEEELRLSFAPTAELICGALTKAYLQPALQIMGLSPVGPNGGRLIAWYDPSELAARPDLAAAALSLYNVGELSGVALRRESGFTEADAPDQAELAGWAWRTVLKDPNLAAEALKQLIGAVVAPPAPVAGPGGLVPGPVPEPARPATGPPPTRAVAPPQPAAPPPVAASARGRVLVSAGASTEVNGNGRR